MKVSIIVPIFNIEKYLSKCLSSIVSQTYKDLEVLLVDDGSSDNSKVICMDYVNKYPSLFKYFYKKNNGLSDTRNFGLDRISGDAVLFIDGDDSISYDCIEKLVNVMLINNSDIVIFPYKAEYGANLLEYDLLPSYIDGFNVKLEIYPRLFGLSDEQLAHPLDSERFNTAWGKLYRSSVIRDIRFVDTRKIGTEDAWFNINVFLYCKKVVYCSNAFYFYNRNVLGSITRKYNPFLFEGWKKLYELQNKFIIDNKLSVIFKESLDNRIILNTFSLSSNIVNSNMKFSEKIMMLNEVLSDEIYKDLFPKFKFNKLPIIWGVFYRLVRAKKIIFIYFFIKLAYAIKG